MASNGGGLIEGSERKFDRSENGSSISGHKHRLDGDDGSCEGLNGESEDGFTAKRGRVVEGEIESVRESRSGSQSQSDSDSMSSPAAHRPVRQTQSTSTSTLYLDTIDRSRLDFDFEKICSVSLSVVNIYACLCCGKYFQGRGKSSYAFVHSVDVDHHVFINLQTLNIYILPEGYEVRSTALDDIKYVVDPWYTEEWVRKLDHEPIDNAFDLNHKQYYPGYVGINNIKANDYANVILQILSHVGPLRDYLMLMSGSPHVAGARPPEAKSETIKKLSILVRKIWNAHAFRAHVSPHELLQHISTISKKRFTPTKQLDPFYFLSWLLNHLDNELVGGRDGKGPLKKKQKVNKPISIIQKTFQGLLVVEQQNLSSTQTNTISFQSDEPIKTSKVPFLCLTLDLPPIPLFKGSTQDGAPVIPQVSLKSLLSKYNGVTTTIDEITKTIKKYEIIQLPQFLFLRIKRITRNILGDADERNPTVVSFSPKNLDMSQYTPSSSAPTTYDLIANVVCELDNDKPRWKVQLLDKSRDQWFQIENLLVEQVQRELLFLNETHIQVWQRR